MWRKAPIANCIAIRIAWKVSRCIVEGYGLIQIFAEKIRIPSTKLLLVWDETSSRVFSPFSSYWFVASRSNTAIIVNFQCCQCSELLCHYSSSLVNIHVSSLSHNIMCGFLFHYKQCESFICNIGFRRPIFSHKLRCEPIQTIILPRLVY